MEDREKEILRKYRREYQRRWREKNPYRAKMTAGKYQEEHREEINARHREWKFRKGKGFPNRWIGVEEFLPEIAEKVLVFDANHGIRFGYLYPSEEDQALHWSVSDTIIFPEVTHWTRLPPEPKEK